jgi:hypothetical protein
MFNLHHPQFGTAATVVSAKVEPTVDYRDFTWISIIGT